MVTTSTRLEFDGRVAGPDDGWSMFLAGDVVCRRDIDDVPITPLLTGRIERADLSVANLEAPVRTDASPMPKSGPTMEQSPTAPRMLGRAGFDAVTLANNHVVDYGEEGLAATTAACREAGLETVGAGEDREAALCPLVRSVGGTEVAVFSVCEREFGAAERDRPGTAWQSHPDVDDRISAAADRYDAVVVVSHGGIEEVPVPPPERRDRFHEFVDLGADAVVGHHPHVAQGWEVYEGRPMFYSLGNFYFEQTNPNTRWGLAVDLRFDGARPVAADLVPVELVDGTLHELGAERSRADRLAHLHRLAAVTSGPHLEAYWQEVAERVFLARLGPAVQYSTGSSFLSLLRSPTRLLRKDGTWDADRRTRELLVLLNVTRNESLRSALTTALEVRTGDVVDRRTPEIQAETRELLERTAEQPMYDRPHEARSLFEALLGRLRREGRGSIDAVRTRLPSFR